MELRKEKCIIKGKSTAFARIIHLYTPGIKLLHCSEVTAVVPSNYHSIQRGAYYRGVTFLILFVVSVSPQKFL